MSHFKVGKKEYRRKFDGSLVFTLLSNFILNSSISRECNEEVVVLDLPRSNCPGRDFRRPI